MENMQENDRWSITLGPDYSDITRQALEASVGLARPVTQLRTTKDMPDDLWELACKRILEGGGQPAFYNEKAIIERLKRRIPHLTHEDAMEFACGGCTETSFAGYTCASGTDLNINVLQIFEQYMHENLPKTATFEEFYENFCTLLHQKQDEQMAEINARWNECAERCYAPIRTLFVDDCIDKETGWLQSGARYTFAIHSDSGMPNTIDSLLAIRHLIYKEKRYTPEKFLALLTAEDPDFFTELRACPAYGVGDPHADGLVKDLTTRFYEHYLIGKLDLGIGFFPTAHQFSRHVAFGSVVGASKADAWVVTGHMVYANPEFSGIQAAIGEPISAAFEHYLNNEGGYHFCNIISSGNGTFSGAKYENCNDRFGANADPLYQATVTFAFA
jgi:formate C-acetyltransferase